MKKFKTLFSVILILAFLFSFTACEESPRCWYCNEEADLEHEGDNYCAECFYEDAWRCPQCEQYFLEGSSGGCSLVEDCGKCYLCWDCCENYHSYECSYCGTRKDWQNTIFLGNSTVCTMCIYNLIDSGFISSENLEDIFKKGFEKEEKYYAESGGFIEAPISNNVTTKN